MKAAKKIRRKGEQSGIALLLAIFVLLLVAVVGLAMMGASGTEVSLTGNYRSSTAVYYAALSGLEEGRGRLLPKNPDYLSCCIPPIGTVFPLGHVIYITNPIGSEPTDTTSVYPDTEWATEFPNFNPPSNIQITASVINLAGTPNPFYKWVRINAFTEWAVQLDINQSGGAFNKVQPIYFDGTNLTRTVKPYQALEVSALAALPDGSRKLLQYIVGPVTLNLQFNAALTLESPGLPGNTVSYTQPPIPASYSFRVNGTDQCLPAAHYPGIGVLNSADVTAVTNVTNSPHPDHYTGTAPSNNVSVITPNAPINWQDPTQLTNLVQQIQNSADTVVTGPATGSDMPSAMNSSNPMTVVVNGDLTLSGYTGYGLLVVTGKLTYSGDSGWKGIVLVIGNGVVEETGSGSGGEFDGAVFVANTTGGGGGGGLGAATYTVASPGGNGIFYNSCWIAAAQKPTTYKVLSFHEIPYP